MHSFHTSVVKKYRDTRQIIFGAGEILAQPLEISLGGEESALEILVGRGASATVFDTSTSVLHSVSVVLEPESELTYVSLGFGSARRLQSTVGPGAAIHWHCTTIGGNNDQHSLVSTCSGSDARSNIDWIFAVQGKEKQSVTVRNIFAARNGSGEITLKGVAVDNAYATCNGMIEITEEGTGTDTYLTEDVLMLDATAKVDAIPGLEIRTNDVKASHSATVSRVTAEDLFYFQSRGIKEETARMMYVDGFLGDLTGRITDERIRSAVLAALKRLLPA